MTYASCKTGFEVFSEKTCVGFWPVLCRLCVGDDEG